jgi:4-oxalocrotonate tautomerase
LPIVKIDWIEGRTVEQKQVISEKFTQAMVETVGCLPEAVTIIFTDHPRHDFAKGGKLLGN